MSSPKSQSRRGDHTSPKADAPEAVGAMRKFADVVICCTVVLAIAAASVIYGVIDAFRKGRP